MAKDTRIEQTMTAVGGVMMLAAAASACVVDGGLTLAAYGGALLNKLLDTASGFGLSKGMDRATEVLGGGNDPASVLENEHLEKVIAEALALRMEIVAQSLADDQQREAVEQIAKEVRRDTKFLGPDVLFELFSTRPNDFGREQIVSKASFQGQLGEVIRRVRSSRAGLKHSLRTETQQRIVDGWTTYFAKDVLSVVTQDDTLGQRAFAKLTLLLLGTILAETKQATSADDAEAHQKALEATEAVLQRLDDDVRASLGDVVDWLEGIDGRLGRIEGKVDEVKKDTTALKDDTAILKRDTATIIGLLVEQARAKTLPSGLGLPNVTSAFTGRTEVLETLLATLRTERVVNLTGLGGIGKSEVARLLCHAAQGEPFAPNGVRYVDCSKANSEAAILSACVRELGLDRARDALDLAQRLAPDTLYVLDDLQQALRDDERATRALVDLLAERTSARYLITTRWGLARTCQVPLGKLMPPDDAALFCLLAARKGVEIAPDDAKLAALLSADDGLDGYPLAITLAAGRLGGGMGLDRLLKQWRGRRTTALRTPGITHDTKLDSVDYSLALSFNALPKGTGARRLFLLLPDLPAGASNALLDAVLPPEVLGGEDAVDAAHLLHLRSLVDHDGTRYKALVPVREFAARYPVAAERAAVAELRERLDAFLLDLAEDWGSDRFWTEQARAVQVFTAELPNLHATLDRAADGGDDATLSRLSHALLRYYGFAPPSEETQRRLEAARSAAQRRGDPLGEANIVKVLGDVHMRVGEYAQARGRYEEALPIYRDIGEPLGEANTVKALGDVYHMLGKYAQARGRYEEALPVFRDIGSRLGEANTVHMLGEVHMRVGEYAQARGRHEEALPIYRDIGEPLGEANTVQALGRLAQAAEQYDEAATLLGDALVVYQAIGARLSEAHTRWYLGLLFEEEERWAEAIAELERSIEVYGAIGLENDVALSQQRIAAIRARM